MYFYIAGSKIVASAVPLLSAPVHLSKPEETAAVIVYSVLEEHGVSSSSFHYERTDEYLKIVAHDYFCFCRLKLTGRSFYIELTISSKDAKRLSSDPRFSAVSLAKKRFTRIPISCAEDVSIYSDVVFLAFVWGTTTV